jgi:transcriptional regulator with XRE-family HTH domain
MVISMPTPVTPTGTTTQTLGDYLKQCRQALRFSLRDVEEKTHRAVSNGTLSQIENGHTKRPSPNVLHALSRLYGIDYGDLLVRAGHHAPDARKPEDDAPMNIPLRAIAELTESEQADLLKYIAFIKQQRPSGRNQ